MTRRLLVLASLCFAACDGGTVDHVEVQPTLEDRKPNGDLYTPSTQSFLRGQHWLDGVDAATVRISGANVGRVELEASATGERLDIVGIDLEALVPRLHYRVDGDPDRFDAYNLMMAEFSRNGVTTPTGAPGDTLTHFETDLDANHPWTLDGPYGFKAERTYRPLRVSVVNNCLDAGKWELNATDPAGEVFHGWFRFPMERYTRLVADANGLPEDFVADALQWRTDPVAIDLDRLRTPLGSPVDLPIENIDSPVGYSSQGSRRKLSKGFVKVMADGALRLPERMSDFARYEAHMSDFSGPGKYSIETRKPFDLAFLHDMTTARLARVTPRTAYRMDGSAPSVAYADQAHLEIELVGPERRIVLGNLPLGLLVHQAEYGINGFGVGILPASEPAERRALLLDTGPHPSFAYLVEDHEGVPMAVNSHDAGVEQVFIRTRPHDVTPHFEIVVTSFERIVDLVRYRVPIPDDLLAEARAASDTYITPSFRSYRDDNVR